jgi:general secretion pathway protein J
MTRARGFTLIEVLVALSLMALVAVLAWRATASLVDGESRLAGEAQRWRALDAAFARLEGDMRQALPRGVRNASGAMEPAWIGAVEAQGASAIVFTRAGAEFAVEPGAAGHRIGYRLRDAALEVVYWPALDRAREAEPAGYALVDGIAGLRIAQLGARGQWSDTWPLAGDDDVPRAVRVRLSLATGETIERLFALR